MDPTLEIKPKSEARIQQEIVTWYRNQYCLAHHNPRCMIFSIPNEGRGAASMQLIATGLYPGCADLCVIQPWWFGHTKIYPVVFFEVKRPGGIQSQHQKKFQAHCKQMTIPYHVVYSLDDFRRIVEAL